jgi:flagellar hook-length control protein FliK
MAAADETGKNAETRNNEVKTEVAGTENKVTMKEPKAKTETVDGKITEDGKIALEGKTEKVSAESKGSRKQDNESETGSEASKEVPIAVNTKQNKPVTADMTAIGLEQAVIEDNAEIITNQAETPRTQTLSKAEIINQIVKKAEIVFTDVQSEMRMQLEPENLGRLNLKIAVERGLITAKFTAESYEVKQIIESSFNELKDMLQEKGLEVQNFSVSVGQDNREYNNNNAFQQWKETVKLNGSNMNKGGYEGYLSTEEGTRRIVNPYSIHNGKFDHIA